MTISIIVILVLLVIIVFVFARDAIVSRKRNKILEEKLEMADALAKKREESLKEEHELFQALLNEKDKLKVEADEKKHKIRTGNPYDDFINGVDQLRDSAEGATVSGKS